MSDLGASSTGNRPEFARPLGSGNGSGGQSSSSGGGNDGGWTLNQSASFDNRIRDVEEKISNIMGQITGLATKEDVAKMVSRNEFWARFGIVIVILLFVLGKLFTFGGGTWRAPN